MKINKNLLQCLKNAIKNSQNWNEKHENVQIKYFFKNFINSAFSMCKYINAIALK